MQAFPRAWVFGGGVFWLLASAAMGQVGELQTDPPVLEIPRVAAAPRLDDYVHDGAPPNGAVVHGFRQREPGDGVPVSQETTAYLSYDAENLYVLFVCREEPGRLRARLSRRDDIFGDDRVGVFLDTFLDRQRAYVFVTNAMGVQLDGITTEGQGTDYSFDTLWHSEARLTANGYVALLAIPFKSLRFPNQDKQVWGISLGRLLPRNSEASYWPYVTRRKEGFVPQFATLVGLENISPGRNLQFIPYGIFTRARFLDPLAAGGPAFRTENDARVGLDAKFVLRDALTIDVAVNPDFSQVESDEPQVTINQRFEVFFPEKRPFFIENAGFFETRQNLFFSRRIADPQFGARLTGKVGRWALGMLAMDDRAPGRLLPETDPHHGDRAAIAVARVRREVGRESAVGAFFSSRNFGSSFNRIYSLDARLKFSPTWILTGQATGSDDRTLAGERRTGGAWLAELTHLGRHLRYLTRYTDRSPDWRVPLGFVPRVDIRVLENFLDYRWRPEGRTVQSYGPGAYMVVNWDRQGRVQDWIARLNFEVGLTGNTFVNFEREEAFELFQGVGFRKHSSRLSLFSEWLSWLEVDANLARGRRVNFFPAAGLQPFLADDTSATLTLVFRPAPRLRVDQRYVLSRLVTRRGSTPAGFAEGIGIFNNHLLRTKVNYQFTRELSARVILDYNAVLPNEALVALSRSKRFVADVLFTYLLHPGTAIYVGYTDIYDNLALEPGPPPVLRLTDSPTTSTGRQFFVKLSYLFRY
jgi:hypothetical protein